MVKKPFNKTMKIINNDDSESKVFALIGIMLMVIGFAIVMLARKEDKYAMFYAKQGLVLFIACIIAWLAVGLFGLIPILGDFLYEVVAWVFTAFMTALWLIGIVFSLSGEEKDVPIIGHFAREL